MVEFISANGIVIAPLIIIKGLIREAMDSHLLVVPPVSSSSKMSETKMNPTLRELARCVGVLNG
jgi:hypothetical protein